MEKKKVVKILVVLLCLVVIAGIVFFINEKRRERAEWVQQGLLRIDYREQNGALPRVSGHPINEEVYVGYDAVDEVELYVQIMAYNEYVRENNTGDKELSLADFEEYLSSEFNEDGSLRIHEGYEHIRAYVDWYFEAEGDEDITEYWSELERIVREYNVQNPELILLNASEMNIAQIEELIKKKYDPSYEINKEVMME